MPNKTKSIVKKQATGLANWQIQALQAKTPKENIFKRQGRGNRWVDYVKIGYTIQQLNKIFSPLGWDFEVADEKETDKDVILKGKLTIKDHKGHTVIKTQYGQADKQKTGVPLGDTYKAAASDALKKCASLLGLSLDVYSPILESTGQKIVLPEEINPKEAGDIPASEADITRIYKLAKELGLNSVRQIENKLKLDFPQKMTKNKASQIYAELLKLKIK
jgi:hypothetical protein